MRSAKPEDVHAIARLHIASWRVAYREALPAEYLASLNESERADQWRARMARPAIEILLAEQSGQILGFCAHGPAAGASENLTSAWEIYSLHVQPQLRGGGIGTLLFNEGLAAARRAASSLLTLWVVSTNTPARRFYERKGMRADGMEKERELAPGVVLHEVRYRTADLGNGSAR